VRRCINCAGQVDTSARTARYTTGCEIQQRSVYQCHKCHYQTSLTAGTLFHGTKLPLRTWFLAIYLLTQRKKSTSALQLSCELGVKYDTAWRLKHKLMQAMLNTSAISRCRSASNSMMPTWAESGRASAVAGPRTISLSSWPLRRRRTAGR